MAGEFYLNLELGVQHGFAMRVTFLQPSKCLLQIFLEVPTEVQPHSHILPGYGWAGHPADSDLEAAREASMLQAMFDHDASESSSSMQQDSCPPNLREQASSAASQQEGLNFSTSLPASCPI